ncbi:hypothetical protein F5Y10DRAFT_267291 [Nemania abortiva]|nr:hypothetical protein F5Y10DRAFT_267291 [Nemania abortiva]
MWYYKHSNVKTLEVIGENWYKEPGLNSRESSRTKTLHDAQSLVRLVSTSSWAIQDPFSEEVANFVRKYHAFEKIYARKIENTGLVGNTHPKNWTIGQDQTRALHSPRPDSKYPGTMGHYTSNDTTIRIFRYADLSSSKSPQALIHTLAQEMCHVYLDVFSDRQHPRHDE